MTIHKYFKLFGITFILVLLSGCMFPQGELAKNKIPNEAQLDTIQTAIDQYREDNNGLLPIRTKPNETPIFEKYLIDFDGLIQQGFISEIPGSAYENGGIYQYSILYPDKDPQVKLIDLRLTEEIRRINVQLDQYRNEHMYPPFDEKIEKGIYTIDYKKLGFDSSLYVKSPYSDNNLPIIMNSEGKLFIDYRIDLNDALKEYEHDYESGDDIRYILAENTPFMPVYSLPYTIENNEPVFDID